MAVFQCKSLIVIIIISVTDLNKRSVTKPQNYNDDQLHWLQPTYYFTSPK